MKSNFLIILYLFIFKKQAIFAWLVNVNRKGLKKDEFKGRYIQGQSFSPGFTMKNVFPSNISGYIQKLILY